MARLTRKEFARHYISSRARQIQRQVDSRTGEPLPNEVYHLYGGNPSKQGESILPVYDSLLPKKK